MPFLIFRHMMENEGENHYLFSVPLLGFLAGVRTGEGSCMPSSGEIFLWDAGAASPTVVSDLPAPPQGRIRAGKTAA